MESISSQTHLPPSIDIDCLTQSSSKVPPNEPSYVTLKNNSIEPLFIRTINLVHRDATNIPPIPPSLTLAPCENLTNFEPLNIHRISGCRKLRNQKHLTTETNESLVNSGLLLSTIGSFATIANLPKGKTIKKRRQNLYKFHMDIVFGECVALEGHLYALI